MDNNLPAIFIEAAHKASLLPMASEATIYAMQAFGTTLTITHIGLAILGAMLGQLFNLALGRGLMKLPSSPKDHRGFVLLQHYFNRFGFVLLLVAPLSLGNFLVFLAGMLGTPMKKALPVIALSYIFYYGRLLF